MQQFNLDGPVLASDPVRLNNPCVPTHPDGALPPRADAPSGASPVPRPTGPSPAPAARRPEGPDIMVRFLVAHPALVRVGSYAIVLGAIGAGLFLWFTGRLEFKDQGYTSAFLLNLIGSGALIIPVPGFAAVCGGAASSLGLNPVLVGGAGALGAALGEVTGYLAGFGGQTLVARFRVYARVRGWVLRRGGLALFILAALPNPLFDVAGIAAGGLGYPLHKFLFYVFAGKVVRFIGIAYACRYGIDWITRFS